jgi:guanosine-3',5'-bis(diphosphate) 3'-pyrophosphohydrolase
MMIMDVQSFYQKVIKFACYKHLKKKQKVKGTKLPYVVHLSNVAMEIFMAALNTEKLNLAFAVQVAILHDTIEDTSTSHDEIKDNFGADIADAVLALSKYEYLPKKQQTKDSLIRIKRLSKEVWAVKLADRITNLQPPPTKWSKKKRIKYHKEAKVILKELKEGNEYLAKRLKEKIKEYGNFINQK